MIVTTAGRTNEEMIQAAKDIASEMNSLYIERRKQSIKTIQSQHNEDCLVVGKERLELFIYGETEPFFFHPNSAMFRVKRFMRGESDPFLEVTKLKTGMSFLDCTLGLGSDSIVASFVVGPTGYVCGIEGNSSLAFIVDKGLKHWDSGMEELNKAMRNIHVTQSFALPYLKTLKTDSIDCVYLDPMFEENILESDGIKSLTKLAIYAQVEEEWINEAKRVAKERVVLKDHFRSNRFKQLGFTVIKRPTAKFHYGYIEV